MTTKRGYHDSAMHSSCCCDTYSLIPPDASPVRLRSDPAAEPIRFNYNQCLYFHQLRNGCGPAADLLRRPLLAAADTQSFYFCRMPDHGAAIQHTADRAGQEVEHKHKIKHLFIFQNKINRVHNGQLHLSTGRGRSRSQHQVSVGYCYSSEWMWLSINSKIPLLNIARLYFQSA